MRLAACALLFLTTAPLGATEVDSAYVGKVLELSKDHMELDLQGSIVSIGFALDPATASSLEKIKVGQEVRAEFGTTLDSDGDRINKLVSIRVCSSEDQVCVADRVRQGAERAEGEKRWAAVNLKNQQCRQAMRVSLANDSRYVPDIEGLASNGASARYSALTGAKRSCASKILRQHTEAVVEACRLHHCGDNVGGGCSHIAGYAMTDAAIEKAVVNCGG